MYSRDDAELSLLDHEVILQIGLPGFLVPRCEFQIDVLDEICSGHPKFCRGYDEFCPLKFDALVWDSPSKASGFPTQTPGPESKPTRLVILILLACRENPTERERHEC